MDIRHVIDCGKVPSIEHLLEFIGSQLPTEFKVDGSRYSVYLNHEWVVDLQCVARMQSRDVVIYKWVAFCLRSIENKPPLGLRPKYLFDEDFDNLFRNRALEILDAMRRYVEDNKSIPTEWTDELLGILDWVGNKT